ncbi:MAG TPA: glucose-6-phosphate dehydrogenase assembly protein OpcA [Chloroflexota bacterium]|nr:glucose-6-phosphate dehydrogenase assembly protein OpcA [Chloroflexota bacterium]
MTDDHSESGLLAVGQGHANDVRGIQREIGRLWQDAVAAATTARQSATRASVLNLVVYTGSEQEAERACETIGSLAARHPSRTIVITPSTDSNAPPVEAWVSLHCHILGTNHRQVCHEQIHIKTSPNTTEHLPGTVQPLLIPDLPVFVWSLIEPRSSDHLFTHLLTLAERVIMDSACFADPGPGLARLSNLVDQEGERTSFGDVNWRRLTPLRELIAQFFDRLEDRLYLLHIDELDVEARGGENSAQALLLVGWLAGRLNWNSTPRLVAPFPLAESAPTTNANPDGRHIRLRRHTTAINVHIRPSPRGPGDFGAVTSVTLRATNSGATFEIRPGDDPDTAIATVELPDSDPKSRVARLQPPAAAAILSDELNIFGHDRIYEEALVAIKSWERTK